MKDGTQIRIRSLGNQGEGVGSHEGCALFVPGALPEELVQIEITEQHKKFGRAKLLSIDTPSPHRVRPICPLFGRCGGCQIMHLAYEQQLVYKRQKVVEALRRIGKIEGAEALTAPCLPSPSPLAYRNKIQLPVRGSGDHLKIGLFARDSHNLIEVDHCFIHADLGELIYRESKRLIKESGIDGYDPALKQGELRHLLIKTSLKKQEALVLLVSHLPVSPLIRNLAKQIVASLPAIKGVVYNYNPFHDNVILGSHYELLAGQGEIEEELKGLRFRVSPASFFQVNPAQAEQLYEKASAWAELHEADLLVDAYCGVGTLALCLADKAKRVVGIECVPQAITDAKENARINGISHANFLCGDAEKLLGRFKDVDILLLNPPRKGCSAKVLEESIQAKPKKILYISCDPATLARDLQILSLNGYKIEAVQPFDMFPQTAHVETLVLCTIPKYHDSKGSV